MLYFVTGATGYIGRRLVRRLRAAGHDVRCLVRDVAAARELPELEGAELVRGDITERETLRAMEGADGVFHLAAVFAFGLVGKRAQRAMAINVEGTRHVLELARELEIPRTVYVSSVIVHSDTGGELVDESHRHAGERFRSVYEESKWRAHYEVALPLLEEGMPLIIASPGGVYGPREPGNIGTMMRLALRGVPFLVPGGGCTMPMVHVEDAAAGIAAAMESGRLGETYHLAGECPTLGQMTRRLARLAGRRVWLPLPGWMIRGLLPIVRGLERLLPWPVYLSSEVLRMAAGGELAVSSAKAEAELGWKARAMSDGLVDVADAELARMGRPRLPS